MPTEAADTRTLLIFGASGHARVVADAALMAGWPRVIASDDDSTKWQTELLPGVLIVPPDAVASSGVTHWHVAIGVNTVRERVAARHATWPLTTIVHPHARVSRWAAVGAGCFIGAGAVVAPGAQVGDGVIVNHGAIVDHDAVVSAFGHIAPIATLAGAVCVGSRALIGAGAHVLPGFRIGDDVVVGAGAVVTRDLLTVGTYVGAPARKIS